MANMRVKLNSSAIRELLRSKEVQADLKRRADVVESAAGDGYEAIVEVGSNRARAEVRTATFSARRREARSQTLLRALDRARQ